MTRWSKVLGKIRPTSPGKSSSQLFRRTSRKRYRPRFESLESRALLAVYNWVLGSDGNFGDAGSWINTNTNLPGVPGPTDDASIPLNIVVTSVGNRSVNSVAGGSLKINSGTFTLNHGSAASSFIIGLTVNSGATLRTLQNTTAIIGAEIAGTLNTASGATFRFQRGVINLNAGTSLAGAGQYWVRGDVFGGPLVSVNANLTAPSKFLLENGTLTGNANLTIPAGVDFGWRDNAVMSGTGSTIIQPGAQLHILGTGAFLAQRPLINQGLIQIEATDTITVTDGATIDNRSGAIIDFKSDADIVAGGIGTSGTLLNAGQIRKSAGVSTSSLNIVIQNTGLIDVQSGVISLRNGTSTGTFNTATGTSIDLTGNFAITFVGTNSFTGTGIVNSGSGDMAASGTNAILNIAPTVTFNVYGVTTVPIGSTLTVNGNMTFNATNNFFLRGGGLLVSNGNITQTGLANLTISGDVASNAVATTLRIPAGKFYNFDKNSGVVSGGGVGGIIENFGTLRKRVSSGTSLVSVPVVNNKSVVVAKGTLAFHDFTNDGGTSTLSAGATLQLGDNANALFRQNGPFTISGSGVVALPAGSLVMGTPTADIQMSSGVSMLWSGGAITVPVGAAATISGNINQASTAGVLLNGGGTLTFNGNVTQTSTGDTRIDGSAGTSTKMIIPAGRTVAFQGDSGIVQGGNGGGTLTNFGTIVKTAGVGTSKLSVELTKAANLNVNSGVLQLAPAAGVVQGGSFNVSAGAILQLTNGFSNTTMAGTFTGTGAGQIQLTGGTITAEGASGGLTFNFPSGIFRVSGGNINTNAQTVTIQGAVKIEGANNVSLSGAGSVVVTGSVTDASQASLVFVQGTLLDIASTGTFAISSDTDFTIGGGGGFVQVNGTLRKNGGNGLSTIGVPVSNSGTIEARRGTLRLQGGVSEVVGNTLTAGIWSVVGSSTVSATLDFNTPVTTIGVGATVKLSGLNSSMPSLSGLSLVQGTLQLLGGATFANTGDLTNAGRVTLSESSVLDVAGNYSQASNGRLTATLKGTLGRLRTAGSVALAGTLLISFSGPQPAVNSEFVLIENQSASPVAGTFNGLANNATFSVGTMTFRIRYARGTGNDVTLTRIS